jgi:hypothetical protein
MSVALFARQDCKEKRKVSIVAVEQIELAEI